MSPGRWTERRQYGISPSPLSRGDERRKKLSVASGMTDEWYQPVVPYLYTARERVGGTPHVGADFRTLEWHRMAG